MRIFGRMPTLGEMREYYKRDDVLSFLYDECRIRNVDIAFRRKRDPIKPESRVQLQEIIDDYMDKIERSYRKPGIPIDHVRLNKFDYLSFHSHTSIISKSKLVGFDTIFEADLQGWRRAFEDLMGVIGLLDDYGVCYRIKYSGVRSLHFMIPFEAFPEQFEGSPILGQRTRIQKAFQDYFKKHCGMKKAHGGGVMRLAYSLNEDNGLVSLPITSDELPRFRPWQTIMHNVSVEKPWHGDVPPESKNNMLGFMKMVFSNSKSKARKVYTDLAISPVKYSSGEVDTDSLMEIDTETAWKIMTSPSSVSLDVLEKGLVNDDPDIRWYMTESLQKNPDQQALKLAGKMLWDEDQLVRIGAIDTLVLSGERSLDALSESLSNNVSGSIESFSDTTYAMRKISPDGESALVRSALNSRSDIIATSITNLLNSNAQPWRVIRYIRQLKELCKQYEINDTTLFQKAIQIFVPDMLKDVAGDNDRYFPLRFLRELRRNDAIVKMAMKEIADSEDIDDVKVPANRMDSEERNFLSNVIRDSISNMNLKQKTRLLVSIWQWRSKTISKPTLEILERFKQKQPPLGEFIETLKESTQRNNMTDAIEALRKKNIDDLIDLLADTGWTTRNAAARVLSEKCKTDEDVGKIISVLTKAVTTKTRQTAVKALGYMSPRNERAKEALVNSINSSKADVRRAALRMYVESGPADAVDLIFRTIDTDRSGACRYDAVNLLRYYLADERVKDKLQQLVSDQNLPIWSKQKAQRLLQRIAI